MAKTWIITGCSSGLGKVLAEAVLARGDSLIATARDRSCLSDFVSRYPNTVRTCSLDVTKEGEAAAAIALAEQTFGTLDIRMCGEFFLIHQVNRSLLDIKFGVGVGVSLPLAQPTGGNRLVAL